MTRARLTRPSPWIVAGAFLVSGTVHLVRPAVFEPLIPRALPRPREIVYVSGVAELACAAGLAVRAPWAGPASAALLVGVWPGNLQMALDATARVRRGGGRPQNVALAAVAWARLPLQVPMIRAVLSTRRGTGERAAAPRSRA
ncbi:DoxX family protein [Parafrankia colletiae]|uniref:DoxX family protein n=1 Tax=Parafrankia colletiae TaxID=573497 RepID=A0A1S1R8Y9_9ACTN|nr:DoxX family protein [Parafrankia colletiae]MCK9900110.1 DoxX family protein [Frankia sp. Cpl3]OHV42437.1 DoxX family protein [Parafrankia colletiae]